MSMVSLNMGWIFQVTGRFSLNVEVPTFSSIMKGLMHLLVSLALGHSLLRFSASSQTRVPFVYSLVYVYHRQFSYTEWLLQVLLLLFLLFFVVFQQNHLWQGYVSL